MKRHTNQLLSRNITILDNSSDTDHIDESDECDDFLTIDLPTPSLPPPTPIPREPPPPYQSTHPQTHMRPWTICMLSLRGGGVL